MSPPQRQQQQRPATGPPRLAAALLRLSVRDHNACDGLLGDLQEEYTRLKRRGTRPKRPGALLTWPRWAWYVLAVAGLSGRFLLARFPGAGGAGSRPPITGDAKGRTPMIDTLLKDLRYSVRTLRKSPAFTAVVVLSLALGIGATSTIFSAINPILLRPLPFEDPGRLVYISENSAERPDARRTPMLSTYVEWKEQSPALEELEWVVSRTERITYPGVDGAERNVVQWVSPGLFRLLGVRPILGRHFVAEDAFPLSETDQSACPGISCVRPSGGVIFSYGFWQCRFGGDLDIIGQTWAQNWANHVVVGVMPPGFRIFSWNEADFWEPWDTENDFRWMEPIGASTPASISRVPRHSSIRLPVDSISRGCPPRADGGCGSIRYTSARLVGLRAISTSSWVPPFFFC